MKYFWQQGLSWGACALAFAGPLLGVVAVVVSSPNYQLSSRQQIRESPIGGDFLQEWIGGKIVASGHADRLYDNEFSQSLQHDSELLGYRWSADEYYPMVYPPFYYQLVSPLSALSPRTAAVLWCALNGLAFSVGLIGLIFCLRDQLKSATWLVAGSSLFYPLLLSLGMGQKSGILFLLLVATYILAMRGNPFLSGLSFGLIVFKPHLGLLIGLVMLFKRQFTFCCGALIPVAAAVLISMAMGKGLVNDYIKVCQTAVSYSANPGYLPSAAHNIRGAVQLVFREASPQVGNVVAVATALGALALVGWTVRGGIDVARRRFAIQFSALVVATVLLSAHCYTYDLSILIVPMALMAGVIAGDAVLRDGRTDGQYRVRWAAQVAVIGLLFVGGGMFSTIAERAGVPLSVPILLVWLALLARESNALRTDEAAAQASGGTLMHRPSDTPAFIRPQTTI